MNLNGIVGLALDETRGLLFISEAGAGRVRGVDIASGSLFLFAGAGSAVGPGFGDNGPATSADIGAPDGIVYDPIDDRVYIYDATHGRLRYVDAGGIIRPIALGTACTEPVVVGGCFFQNCEVAVDAAGVYVHAGACGTAVGGNGSAIARLNRNGTVTHIAGKVTGPTGDGGQATETQITQVVVQIASDGTSLFFSQVGGAMGNRVRAVNLTTGVMTTVAGNGTAGSTGDFGPATSATIGAASGIFVGGGQLFIATDLGLRVVE
jgi:serine/threonine-protein kinase